LPAGDTIRVDTSNGTLLYTETAVINPNVGYTDSGTLVTTSESGGLFNTGNIPFDTIPIYFSYSPSSDGTTYFDT
jgi:hypothetical protein